MPASRALEEWATWAFSPSWSTLLTASLVVLTVPILLHWYFFLKAAAKEAPTFLLVGASGSGKTSLLTLFANNTTPPTHTSSLPTSALCTLPPDTKTSADQYRSEHDTSSRTQPSFLLLDTPGHGKLRHHALSSLSGPSPLAGLIFVVDSAAVSSSPGLTETAEFLHDILLVLQKRHTMSKSSKDPASVPVLVAANKQDVFSSLPTSLVKTRLEEEIGKVRVTRSKGLMDSGIGMDDDLTPADGVGDEVNWLGEYGRDKFEFGQMEESGVEVQVVGGNVRGESGGGDDGRVVEWWQWIGDNL